MEFEKAQDFTLSQSLVFHFAAVRSVDFHGGYLISGSVDKSCKIYKRVEGTGKYDLHHEINISDDFIYCVKVKKDLSGFIIGSKDRNVYLTDIDGNPDGILEGHTNAVCSLSHPNESSLVSGSWDGTARVWDLKSKQCIHILEGHSHAVTVEWLSTGTLFVYLLKIKLFEWPSL
jgi:WD40 repeat protein